MTDKEKDKDKRNEQQSKNWNQEDLDPFEIEFLPQFRDRGPHDPFINSQGVLIGDHMYESDNSPLQQWSTETDPFVMAGDEWVHPYKDVGFQTSENRDYFEKGISPQGGTFMHRDKDVSADDSTLKDDNLQ
jgi:hypothetical protein